MRIELPGLKMDNPKNDSAFLFEERYGFVYLLNDTGYEIIKLLTENDLSEEDVCEHLRETFEGCDDATVLLQDVSAFLSVLREYDLIL